MSTQLENQSLSDFLAKYPVEIELQEVPENPSMDDSREKMINYYVILKREGRSMTLYFSTGLGWVEKRSALKPGTGLSAPMVSYDKKNKRFIQSDFSGKKREADEFGWGGSKYRIKKPTVADVLDCLASDASGADESFEDWASNYGYDTDSRSAERTYQTIQKQVKELRQLLGRDALNELLYQTERM